MQRRSFLGFLSSLVFWRVTPLVALAKKPMTNAKMMFDLACRSHKHYPQSWGATCSKECQQVEFAGYKEEPILDYPQEYNQPKYVTRCIVKVKCPHMKHTRDFVCLLRNDTTVEKEYTKTVAWFNAGCPKATTYYQPIHGGRSAFFGNVLWSWEPEQTV